MGRAPFATLIVTVGVAGPAVVAVVRDHRRAGGEQLGDGDELEAHACAASAIASGKRGGVCQPRPLAWPTMIEPGRAVHHGAHDGGSRRAGRRDRRSRRPTGWRAGPASLTALQARGIAGAVGKAEQRQARRHGLHGRRLRCSRTAFRASAGADRFIGALRSEDLVLQASGRRAGADCDAPPNGWRSRTADRPSAAGCAASCERIHLPPAKNVALTFSLRR